MVFEIIYQSGADCKQARDSRSQSCFLEKDTEPESPEVIDLVKRLSGGKFQCETIKVQKCSAFDAQVLRNLGIPIHRSSSSDHQNRAA
jgi:hypothetical protein